ncbi:MAG: hypothetical protein ACYC56_12030 [Candidatus Aquicultor sp.]
MSERTTPLAPQDFEESEDLLGKVHELSGRWNTVRHTTTTSGEGLGELAAQYSEAVNKVYVKLNENVTKIAASQTRV